MPATIIDGRKISEQILSEVKEEIKYSKLQPRLAIVLVGKDDASKVYVRLKGTAADRVGIESTNHVLPENVKEQELIALVRKLNAGPDNGILVQLPLPKHINEQKVLSEISPEKDVDGLHPQNLASILSGLNVLPPCTPAGIIELLDRYRIPIEGKDAVVVGRSNIVGKPVAMMLTARNATVTICHSKTKDLVSHTKRADILVVAAGKSKLVDAKMVKKGATVIDVGTNMVNGHTVGDVDFEGVKKKAAYLTPVPGGVGPMTVAMLMKNTLAACKKQKPK